MFYLVPKEPEIVSIDGIPLNASSNEKLPEVIEIKVWEEHYGNTSQNLQKTLYLFRKSSFISIEKRRKLMKAFGHVKKMLSYVGWTIW